MTIYKDRVAPRKFMRQAEPLADAHVRVALEHAALVAARLAIARWSRPDADSGSVATAGGAIAAKASWYAQTQHNFEEWMRRGGFAQAEHAPRPLALPPGDARCADACAD